jgi:hypothetical protein
MEYNTFVTNFYPSVRIRSKNQGKGAEIKSEVDGCRLVPRTATSSYLESLMARTSNFRQCE